MGATSGHQCQQRAPLLIFLLNIYRENILYIKKWNGKDILALFISQISYCRICGDIVGL